jgi:uncharacterized membrane protein YpjA
LVVLGTSDEFLRSQHPEALAFLQCLKPALWTLATSFWSNMPRKSWNAP